MTIKEIAKLANVSVSTVSKIMNRKDDSISSETRERVLTIAKEYHYSPYAAVNAPAKIWCIGVLLRSHSSMGQTMYGIVSQAQKCGYSVMFSISDDDTETEGKRAATLCMQRVDGVLWEPINEKSLEHSHYFQEAGIPFLLFNTPLQDSRRINYEAMGYQATQTLVDYLHKRIACFPSVGELASTFQAGYIRCLFENRLPFEEELVYEEVNSILIHKICKREITGIVCADYTQAQRLYETLCTLRYQLPEDVSLVTLQNDPQGNCSPSISSLPVPNQEFGLHLTHTLINQIEQNSPQETEFQPSIQLSNRDTIGTAVEEVKKQFVIIGSINIDIFMSVEELPSIRKTIITDTSVIYPGGKGINQAVGVSLLGNRACLIGNVGADVECDLIYQSMKKYGVDSAGVNRCADINTGKAYIFLNKQGDSMISILEGANKTLLAKDIRALEQLFENACYCLVQTEIPLPAAEAACALAREHGVATIVKPSACGELPVEMLRNINILVPNLSELNAIYPGSGDIVQKAEGLHRMGVETVIVTLGSRGCYVHTHDLKAHYDAADFPTVDSTGASDAFISALASYLADGYGLTQAVKIAGYASGFCVSKEGVVPALVDKQHLESYIRKQEPALLR